MKTNEIIVVYDDQCPFCRNYCKLVKIRKSAGFLTLIDARQPSTIMNELTTLGLNIDQGMVVKFEDRIYYGSDAINILSLLSTNSDFFNKTASIMFRSKTASAILYPLLKGCRNLTLRFMSIPKINNLGNQKSA